VSFLYLGHFVTEPLVKDHFVTGHSVVGGHLAIDRFVMVYFVCQSSHFTVVRHDCSSRNTEIFKILLVSAR
jgi:hypothetical protein